MVKNGEAAGAAVELKPPHNYRMHRLLQHTTTRRTITTTITPTVTTRTASIPFKTSSTNDH
jgi:hypothetical protein